MNQKDLDELFDRTEQFAHGFRELVRKHHDGNIQTEKGFALLEMMQDRTSVFSPWIWSDSKCDFDPVKTPRACSCQYPCDCGITE